MQTPQQIVEMYDLGNITKTELLIRLMRSVTEDNASEFVASIPPELLGEVQEYVANCPEAEEAWARLRWFHAGAYIVPPGHEEERRGYDEAVLAQEQRRHRKGVEVLRDVFGPSRPLPLLNPSWLTPTVVAIAQRAYEQKDFSVLPILADALQDAGCANQDILQHCWQQGIAHVRGCWLLTLLLQKK
jgi:hypothetical protein